MTDFENISAVSEEGDYLLNNRYLLDKKIGEGSYGVVYKARDTKDNNNFVAIKQVSKMRINSSNYLIEALKKELSIMRLLSDENSVKLIEDFETDEHYNFVMELCDSDLDVELKNHVKISSKGFNELEVYEIMTQFNTIFKKMQKEHVIHRDLKLKNIMIKYNKNLPFIGFVIKLSDFGFSKVMNEDDITGTNLGSPATKAPEIMVGKDYNSKADLWSVGVIMYQLFFNRLPFPARNARELKDVIFSSKGVKLPKDSNNNMSDICFSLIDNLLQKEPNKRIDFKQYFEHEFFSQSHKKELIKSLSKEIEEYQKLKEINYLKERLLKNSNNSANDKKDSEKKCNKKEIKYNYNKNKNEFEKRFTKIIKIKEYNSGYSLYKAKDTTTDKNVYIKEISRSLIDNNVRNKKIFDKEIELLSILENEKFPKFIDLYITDTHYNIIIEYFSGNNLYYFINRRPLEESLVYLILKQLIPCFIELKEKNIILEFISPKSFAFTYYQNYSNFEIKFFDYGLLSIFYDEKYIKYYLLEEAELGKVSDFSVNILSIGLTVYKMLFREEASIKKNGEGDYDVTIKGKIKSEYRDNLKNFLSRCIRKEKRYKWEELILDVSINFNEVNQKYMEKMEEPMIKDKNIEKLFEIIIKKLNNIIKYFNKSFDDKGKFMDSELYDQFYDDIVTFILFCKLECITILKFLKTNTEEDKNKIDKTNQEIHLLKIYLNKNNKDVDKYDYTFINFVDENKNNNLYLYNKENPTFEAYIKIFNDIKSQLETIHSKFIGDYEINYSLNNLDRSISSSDGLASACSSFLNNTHEKALSDNVELKNEKSVKMEGNFDKLFMKFFENGTLSYSFEEKEKAIEDLYMARYLAEYIIFLRIIIGNKDSMINFDKINLNDDESNNNNKFVNENNSNENENTIITTFVGGKIKLLKEKGILGYYCNESSDNLAEYNNPKIDNIKTYDTLINFYSRILQFISEIKKEQK